VLGAQNKNIKPNGEIKTKNNSIRSSLDEKKLANVSYPCQV